MAISKKYGPIVAFVLLCAVATTYVLATPMQDSEQALPASVADLATVSQVEVRDSNGGGVLSGQFGAEAVDGPEVKRKATLRPSSGTGKGDAEIELDADNRANQELEVSVQGVAAAATYQVFVDGQLAGSFKTNSRGNGDIELSRGEDND